MLGSQGGAVARRRASVLTPLFRCCPDHTGFPDADPSLLLPADIRSRAHTVIRYWLSLIGSHFALIIDTDTLRDFVAWLTRLLACGDGFRRIINEVSAADIIFS